MKIHKGDKIKVISGKDKGKISTVIKVIKNDNTVLVEGVNIVSRHVKPNQSNNNEGGIVKFEKPIHVSNVMYYSEEHKKTSRLGYKIENGKKQRYLVNLKTVLGTKTATDQDTKVRSKVQDKEALKKKASK